MIMSRNNKVLRLLEVTIPDNRLEDITQYLESFHATVFWRGPAAENYLMLRLLLPAENTNEVSRSLREKCCEADRFDLKCFSIEATEDPAETPVDANHNHIILPRKVISREELYSEIAEGAVLSKIFLVMVIISALVAALGLMRGDMAVIIGAMVIAPLLRPNFSLALAAILGDLGLGIQALKVISAGLLSVLVLSVAIGTYFTIDPNIPEIFNRTKVSTDDVILALAAGAAGTLAYTTGVPASMIGVMVAVALLPPLVTSGMLIGAGYYHLAKGALLLTVVNSTCVILAGIVTFFLHGIRPKTWWEPPFVRKASFVAFFIWMAMVILFLFLFLLIYLMDIPT